MGRFKDIAVYSVLSIGLMTLGSFMLYLMGVQEDSLWLLVALVAFMFIPSISAVVVDKFLTRRGIRRYGAFFPRFDMLAFGSAYVYPWLLVLIGGFIALVIGLPVDFTLSSVFEGLKVIADEYSVPFELLVAYFIIGLLVAPLINSIPAFGEELGWRGFLLDRLIEEIGVYKAIIVSGVIWGVWHFPLILLFGYNYAYETRFVGALVFLIFTVSLGIFLSWLKIRTKNVLYPALAHGAINAYMGYGTYMVLTDKVIGYPAGIIPSLVGLVLGILIMLRAHSLGGGFSCGEEDLLKGQRTL